MQWLLIIQIRTPLIEEITWKIKVGGKEAQADTDSSGWTRGWWRLCLKCYMSLFFPWLGWELEWHVTGLCCASALFKPCCDKMRWDRDEGNSKILFVCVINGLRVRGMRECITSAPLLYKHSNLEQRQTNPKNLKKNESEKKPTRAKKRTTATREIFRKWALTQLQSCAQTPKLARTISQMQIVYASMSLNHLLRM